MTATAPTYLPEPRTVAEMMSDLLGYVVEAEWSGTNYTGCSCHPDKHDACPHCSAFESLPWHIDEAAGKPYGINLVWS